MASFQILTYPVRPHFMTRKFHRPYACPFSIRLLHTPVRPFAIGAIESKTVPISRLRITSQSYATARPSRGPRPNVPPPFRPPVQSRPSLTGQSSSFWDRRPSFLVWSVVVVCGSCYVYARWAEIQSKLYGNDEHVEIIIRNFMSSLTNYREGRWWTLLTSTIMHISFTHLLMNMCFLVGFRTSFILLGPRAFVITWLGAGVFSSAASLIHETIKEKTAAKTIFSGSFDRDNTDGHQTVGSLGASGSLVGLFALLTCMMPWQPTYLMMIPIPIPAWQLLSGGAAFSLAALQFGWLPRIGHDAHLGGAVFGVLYYVLLRGKARIRTPILKK